MEKKELQPKTSFSAIQNVLAGIACSFYAIYRYYLSDPKIIKDLGAAYPWLVMAWVMIMLLAAGLSGPKLFFFIVKYAPLIAKAISNFRKDVTEHN